MYCIAVAGGKFESINLSFFIHVKCKYSIFNVSLEYAVVLMDIKKCRLILYECGYSFYAHIGIVPNGRILFRNVYFYLKKMVHSLKLAIPG